MLLKSALLLNRRPYGPDVSANRFVNVPKSVPVFSCKRFARLPKAGLDALRRLDTDPYAVPERGNAGWVWVGSALVPCFFRHASPHMPWQRSRLPKEPVST